MKKVVIIVNIILLCFVVFFSEMFFYAKFLKGDELLPFKNRYKVSDMDILTSMTDTLYPPNRYVEPNNYYEKAPILLLGCSYAYGMYLKYPESFHGLIERYANRWVYNYAVPGADIAVSLMLMQQEQKHPLLWHKPDRIIYVYAFHHLQRLAQKKYYDFYRKQGLIDFQKYNPLYKSYTYSYFKNRQLEDIFWKDRDFVLHQKLFMTLMSKVKKICDTLYPNSKFTVLIYCDENFDHPDGTLSNVGYDEYKLQKLFDIMYSEEFKKQLEDIGIEVITTEELIGRRMNKNEDRFPKDANRPHPSPSAWEMIIPKLIERLKL